MKGWPINRIYRIPLIYFLFSVLWILFSDKIAFAAAPNISQAALFSTLKGLFFVVSSTLLIYFLVKHDEFGKQRLLNEMTAVQRSFNLLFEDNPQPMWIYENQDMHIIAVNPAACRVYGYSANEFRRLKLTDLGSGEEYAALVKLMAEHKSVLHQSEPIQHIKKDGEPMMVQLISHPLRSAGIDSTLVSVIDLTEYQKTLVELDTAMQERDDFKSFGYTASHDLKAPLRAIIGYSEILEKEYHNRLDDEGNRFVGEIHKAGESMNMMLDEMLTLTGINRKPIQPVEINLSELYEDLIKTLQAQERNRKVKVTIQPEMRVIADMGATRLITQNLVQNAWKFTAHRSSAHIEMGSFQDDRGETVFFVKDNGLGFDPSYADEIFEPFKRIPNSSVDGHGIGLSIVRRAIERQGGRIWVEAEPDQGARFFFTLPSSIH